MTPVPSGSTVGYAPPAGRHVMVDGWAVQPDGQVDPEVAKKLNDPKYLADVLNTLVELVGMEILKPADMLTVPLNPALADTDEDSGGTTGVVILTTSHGSLHTWPIAGRLSFDLYSCRDFDAGAVFAFLREKLCLSGGSARNVVRGHDPRCRFVFEEHAPLLSAVPLGLAG